MVKLLFCHLLEQWH